ncbi:MAG TPA: lysophospholipase [Arenibaculum sp.]|nr:lysophospholipase [Arenibaculum sp.]
MGVAVSPPAVAGDAYLAADGRRLSLREWQPEAGTPTRAVVLALHGFNDYSNAFDMPARYFAASGIATYAYDQRGFGLSGRPGIWATSDTLVADLHGAVNALRRRHPDVPLHLLGESMGGAVVLTALGEPPPPGHAPLADLIDGAILSAPAVWDADSLTTMQRIGLWFASNAVPWLKLTPPRELGIVPSDNIDMLRALGRDPLVIKETRADAVAGLVFLMTRAQAAIPRIDGVPLLMMYGRNEQVIPKVPIAKAIEALSERQKVAVYERGYHMLLRDLQAEVVWRDAVSWMLDPDTPLPSAADHVPWNIEAQVVESP